MKKIALTAILLCGILGATVSAEAYCANSGVSPALQTTGPLPIGAYEALTSRAPQPLPIGAYEALTSRNQGSLPIGAYEALTSRAPRPLPIGAFEAARTGHALSNVYQPYIAPPAVQADSYYRQVLGNNYVPPQQAHYNYTQPYYPYIVR